MKRAGFWLVAVLLLAGCGAGEKKQLAKDLILTHQVEGEGGLVEGDLARVRVRIINRTDRYVILRDLVPADDSAPITWQVGRQGRLTFYDTSNEYVYTPKTEDTTEPVFNNGLLAPGEVVSFQISLRLLTLPRGFTLRYLSFPAEGLARHVYFHQKGESGVHRFERMIGRDMFRKIIVSSDPDRGSHRTVLFPHYLTADWERKVHLIDVPYFPRAFTREEAAKKAQLPRAATVTTFFSSLNLWVFQQGGRAWLAGPETALHVAPAKNPAALYHALDVIDPTLKMEVEFRDETKTLFSDDFRLFRHLRKGRFRWIAFVERDRLIELLRKVGDAKLMLDVEWDVSAPRLLVTTP